MNYKNILADKYMRDTNYVMIKDTEDLDELKQQWNKFNSNMTIYQKRRCDDRSLEIFKMTNQEHYETLYKRLSFMTKADKLLLNAKNDEISLPSYTTDEDKDIENKFTVDSKYSDKDLLTYDQVVVPGPDTEVPEDIELGKDDIFTADNEDEDFVITMNHMNESFYNNLDSNSIVYQCIQERSVKPRYEKYSYSDLPYFLPSEMLDLGVLGTNNYYSNIPDNDGFTQDISVVDWFGSYQDFVKDQLVEDYRKEWVQKLTELYSDYHDITDQDKLLARKQSILNLGWNPEIDFTPENRMMASKRVNDLLNNRADNSKTKIYDLTSYLPEEDEDESIQETVDMNEYSPVFIIFTEGTTPVISKAIQLFTSSKYSHVSISFDPYLKKSYSYNIRSDTDGFIEEPFSEYGNNNITVLTFFLENRLVKKMIRNIEDFKNHYTNFSIKLLMSKVFNLDKKLNKDKYDAICSTFVDTILKSGDVRLTDKEAPTPADMYTGAVTKPDKIYKIYDGAAPLYNGSKIYKKLLNMCSKTNINPVHESYIIHEVKQFPIEFDEDGNMIIYKVKSGNIDYGDEIHKSSVLLESYRHTGDKEGIKYELAKLWYIIDSLEQKLKSNKDKSKHREYESHRATALNVFKFNMKYLLKIENDFNFGEYYKRTPFSDSTITLTSATIRYSMEYLKRLLGLKHK